MHYPACRCLAKALAGRRKVRHAGSPQARTAKSARSLKKGLDDEALSTVVDEKLKLLRERPNGLFEHEVDAGVDGVLMRVGLRVVRARPGRVGMRASRDTP